MIYSAYEPYALYDAVLIVDNYVPYPVYKLDERFTVTAVLPSASAVPAVGSPIAECKPQTNAPITTPEE
jgi:hypothetical protein